MSPDDYLALKASYRLIETAGFDAISDLAAAEAAKQPTAQLHEHAQFLVMLGNNLAQFTAWSHARSDQPRPVSATAH